MDTFKVILFILIWAGAAYKVKDLVKKGTIKKFDKGWTGPIILGFVASGIVSSILVAIINGLIS